MINGLLDVEDNNYADVIFLGKVIDNNDPLKIERVKVLIPGLYEGDPELLPWCRPEKDRGFGSKFGSGMFAVPDVGVDIGVILDQGDPHCPVYIGSTLRVGNTVAEFLVNYPNRYGFKDASGNVFWIDKSDNTMHFQMASGLIVVSDPSGNLDVTTPTCTVHGDLVVTGDTHVLGEELVEGNIRSNSDVEAVGDMTDLINTNIKTVGNMRTVYNTHTHPDPDGDTGVPNQQI